MSRRQDDDFGFALVCFAVRFFAYSLIALCVLVPLILVLGIFELIR